MRPHLSDVLKALGACNSTSLAAVPWALSYGTAWEEALAACPYPTWLWWLAARLLSLKHFPAEPLALCAAATCRLVVPHIAEDVAPANHALDVIERWGFGGATAEEVLECQPVVLAAHCASKGPYYYNVYVAVRLVGTSLARPWGQSEDRAVLRARVPNDFDSISYGVRDQAHLLAIARRILGPHLFVGLQTYADSLKEKS